MVRLPERRSRARALAVLLVPVMLAVGGPVSRSIAAAGGVALGAERASADSGDDRREGLETARCGLRSASGARLLILALDGVPLRVIEAARAEGGFDGWGEPVGLISTFPSMTNVAFTAMLEPWGAEPIGGYETRHFDLEQNRLIGSGGPSGYTWKQLFTVIGDSFAAKRALYMTPERRSRKVISLVEQALLQSETPEVVLAHMASTDMLAHLRGDEAMVEIALAVSEGLERIIPEHRRRFGRDLEVVLLSDHGNGSVKVDYTEGLRDTIRAAGFRFANRLERSRTVALPTYGAVSYGALYTDPGLAEELATAAVAHPAVDLAAWIESERRMVVLGKSGRAVVSWLDPASGRTFAYQVEEGDPLGLLGARRRLADRGAIDSRGFAAATSWAEVTLDGTYPKPLARLVDSLTGRWVENPATVILSLGPTWAWGKPSVRFGASLMGGRMEGTHGGLDRVSSLGFLLGSDRARQPSRDLFAEEALVDWLAPSECPARPVSEVGRVYGEPDPR